MRFRLGRLGALSQGGFAESGWSGVPDVRPAWPATVTATWMPPTIDWGRFAAGVLAVGVTVAVAVDVWATRGGPVSVVVLVLGIPFVLDVARQLRARRPPVRLTLVLDPDLLRLTADEPSRPSFELRRDEAGWLAAQELGSNWHWRGLALFDVQGRSVVEFTGSMASIRAEAAGDEGGETSLAREWSRLPSEVPVAVLVGSWWPHPGRRMFRAGSLNARFRWRDPELAGLVRRERRQRVGWAVFWSFFWVLCFAAAVETNPTPLPLRAAFATAGVVILVHTVRLVSWRPSYRRVRVTR